MIVQIPTSQTLASYVQKTSLDGQTYTLEFRWNAREEFWYMNLLTADEDPIAMGIKLVSDWSLLRRVTDPRKPPGALMAIDTTTSGVDAGFDELGTRVMLLYFDEAELG